MRLQDDSLEEARRAYEEAIRLRPAFAEAHVNLGLLNHNAGDLAEAEACYRRALQHGPELVLAHFNLGVVLEDQQDKTGAIAAYEEALSGRPVFVRLIAIWRSCTKNWDANGTPSGIMPPPSGLTYDRCVDLMI